MIYLVALAVIGVGMLALGHVVLIADLGKRLKRIEDADAEADKVVDVWYAQAEATVTDKGLES